MKEILNLLVKKNIICKELKPLKLKTKKKLNAYIGINLKNEYCLILKINKTSRILQKEMEEILHLMPDINFRYKKKILLTSAPVCSKTKQLLKDWRIL